METDVANAARQVQPESIGKLAARRMQNDAPVSTYAAYLYLLETQTWGGNSGSPVFFYFGMDRTPGIVISGPARIQLAGIMKGHFNALTPVVSVPNATTELSVLNNGIAAVVPSYLLRDILFREELRKVRQVAPHADSKKD